MRLSAENIRAYQALCSFCSWGLFADPTEDELRGLARQRAMFLEEPFSVVSPEAAAVLHGLFERAESEAGLAELHQEMHLDRTYLFYMVGASRTSPYESVYRTDDATLFGPTTLQVREAYRARGLRFERAASEPDDHVGIEFAFVAHLLGRAAEACEGDEREQADALLAETARFLSEHLLVFGGVYLANVQKQAGSEFYGAVGRVAADTLAALAAALEAEPAETVDPRYELA